VLYKWNLEAGFYLPGGKQASLGTCGEREKEYMKDKYEITTKCLSCDDSVPQGPYLLPPNYPESPFIIYVPNVATSQSDPKRCGITDNSDFLLSWGSAPNLSRIIYAKITVQPTNMLSDDPIKRDQLKQNFALFRQSLEALESNQCIAPGTASIIAQRVASMLVLRLDEILYYYYGFDPLNGIELAAGMMLQVESGAFQYVAPYGSSLPGANLDAFVSSGQTFYKIGLNNQTQGISFSPYLDSLGPYGVTPSVTSAANLVDLTARGMGRRYWRLVYPAQFLSTTSVTQDPGLQYNVALLGADTLSDLANAVSAYRNAGTCAQALPPNSPILCIYFSGRASVVPLIPLIFQQTPYYVPLGTTLRNLLQTFMVQSSGDIAEFFRGVGLSRYSSPGLGVPLLSQPVPRSIPISINTDVLDPISEKNVTVWDVPFVLRDVVSWSWT
jgi:hypothetical protein